jgi:hypothetical protein
VASTAVRGATTPPKHRGMGSGARCSRWWRWWWSSRWRGWWSYGRWWRGRRRHDRRGNGGAGREHDRRGERRCRAALPARPAEGAAAPVGRRCPALGSSRLRGPRGSRWSSSSRIGAEGADGGERDVERDRGAAVDRRLPLKASDHCGSVELMATARFATSRAANTVSSTGATRLSVQSNAGSSS